MIYLYADQTVNAPDKSFPDNEIEEAIRSFSAEIRKDPNGYVCLKWIRDINA